MPAPVAIPAGMAILGGIAGSIPQRSSQVSNTESQLVAAPEGAQERQAREMAFGAVTSLDQRLKALESSPILANLDKLLAEMGQAPSAERLASSQKLAADVFAPQQTALEQSLEEQRQRYASQAALMGRSSSDPILAARLAQEQIRQQARLSSEQGAFAAQEAINAPSRMFANQVGGLQSLQQQAIQNRQAVFGLGSEFANTQMQYRLATGSQRGVNIGSQQSGGGFSGALAGALGGASSGLSIASSLGAFAPTQVSRPQTYSLGSSPQVSFANPYSYGGVMQSIAPYQR